MLNRIPLGALMLLLGCRSAPSTPVDPVRLNLPPNTNTAPVDYEPSWSPDGSRLVFISNRDGPLNLYTVSVNGTGLARLTSGSSEDDSPSWSPDGRSIAFVSTRDGNPEIYRMNADGSGAVRLTDDPGIDIHPTWAPDGRSIIWNSSWGCSPKMSARAPRCRRSSGAWSASMRFRKC